MPLYLSILRARELWRYGGWPGLVHKVRFLMRRRKLIAPPVYRLKSPVGSRTQRDPAQESGSVRAVHAAASEHPLEAVVFSHNLNREGASVSLFELMSALKLRSKLSPVLVAFEDGPLRHNYESLGMRVILIPSVLDRLSTDERLQTVVCELGELIKRYNPSLVFANTLLCFPAILAAAERGIPSIWNPRESEHWAAYFGFLPDELAEKAISAISLPYRTVFVAQATRQVWSEFESQAAFTVIHNGINLDRFPRRNDLAERSRCREQLGLEPDSIAILCVGTLCERKGQMDLVKAFASLPDAVASKVCILLVGDDTARYARAINERCRSCAATAGSGVRVFSSTEAIADFYVAADMFVLSSRVESFPRVVLEAMAFGLPIISTPVFGVLEQVVEGENAVFYQPGDFQTLARHIGHLVTDDARRLQMAAASLRQSSRMTTYDEMIEAYGRICEEAVS